MATRRRLSHSAALLARLERRYQRELRSPEGQAWLAAWQKRFANLDWRPWTTFSAAFRGDGAAMDAAYRWLLHGYRFAHGRRPGRRPDRADWRRLVDAMPGSATAQDVLESFRSLVPRRPNDPEHPVIKAVVRTDRRLCREAPPRPEGAKTPRGPTEYCPAGYHAHLVDPHDPGRFRPLALQTIKNYLASRRHHPA